jgi:hypothetical protein
MPEWINDNETMVWWLAGMSLVMLVGGIFVAPALLVSIPADYFAHRRRPPSRFHNQHPAVRYTMLVVKNIVGYILIIAGFAMLALPGQGLLTIVMGSLLIDFPGKYRFEQWLVRRKGVLRGINWLRRKRGREPLQVGVVG